MTGEVTAIRENGVGSGVGVLGTYAYDDLGRRTSLTRGNGTMTSYTYDAVSRLASLAQDLNGTASDVTFGYSYNPASEIASNTRSNDAYSFTLANNNVAGAFDGLNRITAIGGSGTDHDARGNVIWVPAVGSTTGAAAGFAYTSDNALAIAASGGTYKELIADSVERLHRYYDGAANRWFLYDGQSLVAETNSTATAIARRYVHGPGVDEPLVWYEGSGTSTRRWFHADERGTVIAVSDASGDVVTVVNRYDDYGTPQGVLTGRFGYTGQVWLAEIGLEFRPQRGDGSRGDAEPAEAGRVEVTGMDLPLFEPQAGGCFTRRRKGAKGSKGRRAVDLRLGDSYVTVTDLRHRSPVRGSGLSVPMPRFQA